MKNGKILKNMNGLYQVSNTGKIKSLKYKKILKPSFDKNGYASLNLCKNGKISHRTIHRLVAETFITNTNNYPCVNHKDENPKNNNVENLEWCTYKYNMNYGTGFERRSKNNKIPINQYDKSNNFIKRWSSAIDIQNEIGINQGSIIACCRNKLKTAGGYVWKYAEFNIRQKSKKELIKELDNLKYELQQEKAKNTALIQGQVKTLDEILQPELLKKYISKDKIREQIKQIKSEEANIYFKEHVVYFLQELLEEE